MLVKTENSTYEIEDQKIRRLYGKDKATERQGKDGDWREFETLIGPEMGKSMLIIWATVSSEDAGITELTAKSTMTSPIVEIVEVAELN